MHRGSGGIARAQIAKLNVEAKFPLISNKIIHSFINDDLLNRHILLTFIEVNLHDTLVFNE